MDRNIKGDRIRDRSLLHVVCSIKGAIHIDVKGTKIGIKNLQLIVMNSKVDQLTSDRACTCLQRETVFPYQDVFRLWLIPRNSTVDRNWGQTVPSS